MKTAEKSFFFKPFYTPTDDFELNLLNNLKNEIIKATDCLTSLKKTQVLKILKNAKTTPQQYIKVFSPINLVLGTPGGGFSKDRNLVLHPSWINHPSAFLLAIHEFEHLLYFTDTYFKGDHYFKLAYHFFIHPNSFHKRIESKAIKRTREFIVKNYAFEYFKKLEDKLNCSTHKSTLSTLKHANIIDKNENLNLHKVFSITKNKELTAYKTWEKTLYNKRYLNMIKAALFKTKDEYLKEELLKYKFSLKHLLKEYLLKFSFWSIILATLLYLSH